MPIYKYECEQCGHQFEELRSFSDPNPEACPACQSSPVRRLISGGNFVLKGGGWYVNDYSSTRPASAPSTSSAEGTSTPAANGGDSGGASASSAGSPVG